MTLKRSGFRRPDFPRSRPVLTPLAEPARATMRRADGAARLTVALPKETPERSEEYRRLVAAMRCAHCGRAGPSQCAHGDEGKGLGMKTDDRTSWPGCADAPGRRGCHSILGASGMFTREQRRQLETKYAAQTRAAIVAAGAWPKSLPRWEDERCMEAA